MSTRHNEFIPASTYRERQKAVEEMSLKSQIESVKKAIEAAFQKGQTHASFAALHPDIIQKLQEAGYKIDRADPQLVGGAGEYFVSWL